VKIEKLSNGLWVPSTDAQIEQWREKGYPYMQDTCLNQFIKWCDNQHKKFNLIVDIGAWCGTWSMAMQKYATNIYCYEPNKLHYECLAKNLAPHNHVQLYNQAVGNEDGFVKLSEESATQNTRVLLETGDTKINKLDSLDTEGADMIKIDVEGFELQVLRGALETIKRHRPVITTEHSMQTPSAVKNSFGVVELLESLDYEYIRTIGGDFIWSPKEYNHIV
jgi:FkbM family methyltransferase